MIKLLQIAPAELEAVLATHPDILDAAVTTAKDEEVGEVPMAFVLKRQGSLLSEATVIDYVAMQVPSSSLSSMPSISLSL
ncbi:hypothetical protein RHGRI_020768 [Rhododendron griersonianum]|uniref:4-coumarate--CoA ligase n=1 Tax=Rhododendron griersonianum TaxID=479676 RepID=A0AAV6JKL4_9ERIC|nr:hypothetical protein RHGRI_020768 [Rhododendron griersonianum]